MADIKTQKHDAIVLSSQSEKELQRKFVELFRQAPLPDDEILPNLGLFLSSKALSRILFFYEIYKKIINTHGIIMEFGVRWGQTLSHPVGAARNFRAVQSASQDRRIRYVRRFQGHERQRRCAVQDRGRLLFGQ